MALGLLHYRPWRGQLHGSLGTVWPIARISLWMILRRKLFWALYALALFVFLMFFFGQYLLAWAETQIGETSARRAQRIESFARPFLRSALARFPQASGDSGRSASTR